MVVQLDPVQVAELERLYALPAAPEPPETPPQAFAVAQQERSVISKLIATVTPIDFLALPIISALDLRPPVRTPVAPDWAGMHVYFRDEPLLANVQRDWAYKVRSRYECFRASTPWLDAVQVQMLVRADELLADRDNWVVGKEGEDLFGNPLHPWERGAVKWCAIGAVKHEAGGAGHDYKAIRTWLDIVSSSLCGKSIVQTNDERGYLAMRMCFGATRALFRDPRG